MPAGSDVGFVLFARASVSPLHAASAVQLKATGQTIAASDAGLLSVTLHEPLTENGRNGADGTKRF